MRTCLSGLLAISLLSLSACGERESAEMDIDDADQAVLDMPSAETPVDTVITAAGAGMVTNVSEDGDFITLDHEAIEEINMGAMRMGFEVAEDVDISRYAEGDGVHFRIEATADDIVIVHLCRPSTDGVDCVAE